MSNLFKIILASCRNVLRWRRLPRHWSGWMSVCWTLFLSFKNLGYALKLHSGRMWCDSASTVLYDFRRKDENVWSRRCERGHESLWSKWKPVVKLLRSFKKCFWSLNKSHSKLVQDGVLTSFGFQLFPAFFPKQYTVWFPNATQNVSNLSIGGCVGLTGPLSSFVS